MIKYLIFISLLYCAMTAQTSIKIYTQEHALVQEERKKKFSHMGKQTMFIHNIPPAAESSSINLFSDGRWKITNSKIKFEKLDAYRALFTIDVPANSKKEVHLSAIIEKD